MPQTVSRDSVFKRYNAAFAEYFSLNGKYVSYSVIHKWYICNQNFIIPQIINTIIPWTEEIFLKPRCLE